MDWRTEIPWWESTSPVIEVWKKLGVVEPYLNIIKAINDKLIANIILNGEKFKAFPLKWGTRQSSPVSSYLFSTILVVLATAIRQQREIQIWKEEVRVSLFVYDTLVYISDPKISTGKSYSW